MKERVISIIMEISASDKQLDEISDETTLADDLSIDSLGFIQMILVLESTFNIKFDNEYINMDKLSSVKDVIDYVEEKTSKR